MRIKCVLVAYDFRLHVGLQLWWRGRGACVDVHMMVVFVDSTNYVRAVVWAYTSCVVLFLGGVSTHALSSCLLFLPFLSHV
jgi:hypothetical protein